MSLSLSSILPQITSLQLELSSVSQALQTAKTGEEAYDYSISYGNLQASLSLLSFEGVIATATAESAIESASVGVEEAHSVLSSIYQDQNVYGMQPSFGGNLALTVVMGLFFGINAGLGLVYQTWWFGISYFCGCGLEFAGFLGRALGSKDVIDDNYFLLQIICLTIAPVFIMAGIYFLLGQLITIYGTQFAILKPMWYSYIFITCDFISLVLQAAGGGIAGSAATSDSDTAGGTHIMVGGLAFQVVSMSFFLLLTANFLYRIRYYNRKEHHAISDTFNPKYKVIRDRKLFKYFPAAMVVAAIMVFVRSVYRVVELAQGWDGHLITTEIYFMLLDGLMMSLAIVIFIPFHPGVAYGRGNHVAVEGTKAHRKQLAEEADPFKDEELASFEKSEDTEAAVLTK
jgi:hypothetical protein